MKEIQARLGEDVPAKKEALREEQLEQERWQKEREKKRILFIGGFGYADCSPLYAAPESKVGEKINVTLVKEDRERRINFMNMIIDIN